MSPLDATNVSPRVASDSEDPNATRDAEPAGDSTRKSADAIPVVVDLRSPLPAAPLGYAILSELGVGGWGVVYRARQLNLNRDIAIKTIRQADSSRTTLARFWAEAELMAAVKHPNVVQVIELGEHAGQPYIAMELMPGGSLSDRLKAEGPCTPRVAAELVEKIARGVAAAHEIGIVHRDLKPANVLMDADHTPKVTDFGIAKWRSSELTQTLALMGTPAYMAPEQAAGRAKFVGPTADVWSLGVILYECLSGLRPYHGDTSNEVLTNVLTTEPVSLRTRMEKVPRDLETIVGKCLKRNPLDRYADAGELAADLDRYLRGEPILARPESYRETIDRKLQKLPATAAWGMVLLCVGIVAIVGALIVAGTQLNWLPGLISTGLILFTAVSANWRACVISVLLTIGSTIAIRSNAFGVPYQDLRYMEMGAVFLVLCLPLASSLLKLRLSGRIALCALLALDVTVMALCATTMRHLPELYLLGFLALGVLLQGVVLLLRLVASYYTASFLHVAAGFIAGSLFGVLPGLAVVVGLAMLIGDKDIAEFVGGIVFIACVGLVGLLGAVAGANRSRRRANQKTKSFLEIAPFQGAPIQLTAEQLRKYANAIEKGNQAIVFAHDSSGSAGN